MRLAVSGIVTHGLLAVSFLGIATVNADDWTRFRGPNGTGASADQNVPTTWSDTENLKWKTPLPGPGLSCPIVVGDRVYVTCYTGYGTSRENPGQMQDLRRHLVAVDRNSGEILWNNSVAAVLPEDPYEGFIQEHGYASHTPVSDGERVYAFFGKSGVVAFDRDGKQLWQSSVGNESGIRGWGTASSPILYEDLLIVPASAESEALVALNKHTGSEVWRKEAEGFGGVWGTPILMTSGGRDELVFAVPGEIWSFSPETGQLLWYAEGVPSDYVTTSAVAGEGVAYFVGGRPGGGVAVRLGGEGDVTKSHVLWSENVQGGIPTPLLHNGYLFSFSGDRVTCVSAETGQPAGQARLGSSSGRELIPGEERRPGGRGGRGGGGGGGGQSYASPIVVDGRIYLPTRQGTVHVMEANPQLTAVAQNRFESDSSEFQATPAVSNGQLFLRSNQALYCIAKP
ncbi:MAG: PQQ-binding-like beta-propeller repeat protein [Planctomycetaceae bacterium]|nr:PQQ-binding-like beta-propeller repeat protein [Planctomycetaceae bacterium]